MEWIKLEHYPKSKDIVLLGDQVKDIEQKKNQGRFSKQNELHLNRKLFKLKKDLQKHQLKHQFQLTAKHFSVTVQAKHHCMAVKQEIKYSMTQLPINLKNATTGYNLQGTRKDVVMILSWPTGGLFKKWDLFVLSRVRTRDGLYILRELT